MWTNAISNINLLGTIHQLEIQEIHVTHVSHASDALDDFLWKAAEVLFSHVVGKEMPKSANGGNHPDGLVPLTATHQTCLRSLGDLGCSLCGRFLRIHTASHSYFAFYHISGTDNSNR